MYAQLLRLGDRARVLLLRGVSEMLDDKLFEGVTFIVAPDIEILLEPPFVFQHFVHFAAAA